MDPRILQCPQNVRTGVFPGQNGGSRSSKIRRGFDLAGFWPPRLSEIDPGRIDFRVFEPQKLVFEVVFGRFLTIFSENAHKSSQMPKSTEPESTDVGVLGEETLVLLLRHDVVEVDLDWGLMYCDSRYCFLQMAVFGMILL